MEGDRLCPVCGDTLPIHRWTDREPRLVCCGERVCLACSQQHTRGQNGAKCPRCATPLPTTAPAAVELVRVHATNQCAWALYELGCVYLTGLGVENDTGRAIELISQAAESEYPLALRFLAECHTSGFHGLPQSDTEAWRLFEAAAAQGDVISMYSLSLMAGSGRGIANGENHTLALDWARQSAEGGYVNGMVQLGNHYLEGLGVDESLPDAISWYSRAGQAGSKEAMHKLAVAILTRGESCDKPRAMALYRAAAGEHEPATRSLERFEPLLKQECANECDATIPPEGLHLRCSQCQGAYYCSKDCQREHWTRDHKRACKRAKGLFVASDSSKGQ